MITCYRFEIVFCVYVCKKEVAILVRNIDIKFDMGGGGRQVLQLLIASCVYSWLIKAGLSHFEVK